MTRHDYRTTATWAELTAQPETWVDWARAFDGMAGGVRAWIASSEAEEIWLSGAGSSAYVGDAIAAGLPRAFGRPVRSVPSTDLVSRPAMLDGRRPLVLSFGRSGNSPESLGVMDALDARAPHAPRLHITCNAESALAHRTGPGGRVLVLPVEQSESGFAMTSGFSTMLLTALSLLDDGAAPLLPVARHLAVDARRIIAQVARFAKTAPVPSRIAFIGTGALQFAAREAALKLLELTAGEVAALWESTLGFRHGPKSFVRPGTELVLMRSSDPHAARYDDDLAGELATQFPAARRTVIGPGGDVDTGAHPDLQAVPLHVLWAQVTGVIWSARLGLDPDDPFRGQGTLTRVVTGVTLHDPRGVR